MLTHALYYLIIGITGVFSAKALDQAIIAEEPLDRLECRKFKANNTSDGILYIWGMTSSGVTIQIGESDGFMHLSEFMRDGLTNWTQLHFDVENCQSHGSTSQFQLLCSSPNMTIPLIMGIEVREEIDVENLSLLVKGGEDHGVTSRLIFNRNGIHFDESIRFLPPNCVPHPRGSLESRTR